nr:aminotransferase class III-fold pyridoxal phosphate-dependent enzyme [Angustibacter aerolatus]
MPADTAHIVVAGENFHGRTIAIVGFSTDPDARDGFGPFAPGFTVVPYGDAEALAAAITPSTVGVLLEPVQGEAGVVVPPKGYLTAVRDICTRERVLMLADEVQSGLGRTGHTFACDAEGVVPDVYVMGKALGGGILPVSGIAADRDVMDVLHPGQHGSTFGGNPLACAVARAVIALLETGEPQARSREPASTCTPGCAPCRRTSWARCAASGCGPASRLADGMPRARLVCERLLERGVLAKDTHEHTIRLAPPLVVTREELDWAVDQARGRDPGRRLPGLSRGRYCPRDRSRRRADLRAGSPHSWRSGPGSPPCTRRWSTWRRTSCPAATTPASCSRRAAGTSPRRPATRPGPSSTASSGSAARVPASTPSARWPTSGPGRRRGVLLAGPRRARAAGVTGARHGRLPDRRRGPQGRCAEPVLRPARRLHPRLRRRRGAARRVRDHGAGRRERARARREPVARPAEQPRDRHRRRPAHGDPRRERRPRLRGAARDVVRA